MKSLKLDKINRAILRNLQNNARISNLALAEIVNISPSACLQRTRALENADYIQGYIASINIDAICVNVMAYFMFSLHDHSGNLRLQFSRLIAKRSEIIMCLKVDGGLDYIALATCSTVKDLDALREQLLVENSNILKITTNIILDRTKRFVGYPLEDLLWRD